MGKFGWSYPPGVTNLPWDEDYPCEMCFKSVDDCACPECGVCGEVGNPVCYDDEGHGLVESKTQIESRETYLKQLEREHMEEAEYLRELEKEYGDAC